MPDAMSFVAALDRISEIQSALAPLNGAAPAPAPAPPVAAPAGAAPATFAAALAQAQQGGGTPPAAGQLTAGQQAFASRLAQRTGLDPRVISAWLLAEESGGAAQAREQAHNNNWLNIGYTDSGTYGAGAAIWADPTTAADATAGWLQGQDTIPGYGRASAGIQAVLSTAGRPPEAQVAALQRSGWASSGYPTLPTLLRQVGG
jgi:hypothetical protein